jgi:uncharacterized protein (DUF1810 family)
MTERAPSFSEDSFHLERFVSAQEGAYPLALAELRAGRKRSHWIWFVFPQIDGLGFSETTRHFAIKSLDEARAFLAHPVLGARLRECAEALLQHVGRSISDILPYPDHLKLQSSMTLFELAAPPASVFAQVLDQFYRGTRDERTLKLVAASPR